jgi:hypothetical protein
MKFLLGKGDSGCTQDSSLRSECHNEEQASMRKTPSKAYRDKITNLVGVRLLILSQQDRYVVKRKKVWMKEVHPGSSS